MSAKKKKKSDRPEIILRERGVYANGPITRQITSIERVGTKLYILWKHLGVEDPDTGCCLFSTFKRWVRADVSMFWPNQVLAQRQPEIELEDEDD